MTNRIITIQPKGTAQLRSYDCQLVMVDNIRTYVLDNTSQNLSGLAPGCKVFDDSILYRIKEIWYSPDSKYAFIAVYRDLPV